MKQYPCIIVSEEYRGQMGECSVYESLVYLYIKQNKYSCLIDKCQIEEATKYGEKVAKNLHIPIYFE